MNVTVPTDSKIAPEHGITESISSCECDSVCTNEVRTNTSLQSSWLGTIDDFVVIWLDSNMDEADCEYVKPITKLRCTVKSVKLFTNEDDCKDFLQRGNKQKIFLIVSEIWAENLIPKIHHTSQLDSIYILCKDTTTFEHLPKRWRKIEGVFTDISLICNYIEQNTLKYKHDDVPISIVSASCAHNLNEIDSSFMYSQLIKQVLLEMEYDEQSKRELVNFLCAQDSGNKIVLDSIRTFDHDYYNQTPIWWYTKEPFIYSVLNKALRTQDVEIIIKMGFIVRDVHRQIEQVYLKTKQEIKIVVYRGQCIPRVELEKIQQSHGGLLSFNNFLSTSTDRQVACCFANAAWNHEEFPAVLFQIDINPSISSTAFAPLNGISYFSDQEGEILFSMHSVFRIENTHYIDDQLWQINLTLTNDNDEQLKRLTHYIQEEIGELIASHQLGHLMIKMGEFDKAERLFVEIIKVTSEQELEKNAHLYHQLGYVKYLQGDNSSALAHFERSCEIKENTPSLIDLNLAKTYSAMGTVYMSMANYSATLECYGKSMKIKAKLLSPTDPDWAITYNNMGKAYYAIGNYSIALSYMEKSLKIKEKYLPPIHPSLATNYNDIGVLQRLRGDYSTALSYYEKTLEIERKSLPSKHPSLAITYNNIAAIHDLAEDYPAALTNLEKTLDIQENSLPSTHYDLAKTHNNIGKIHISMENYSIALSHLKKALEIQQNSLPSTHPDLATTYNNLGKMYLSIGNYSTALVHVQKALEIQEKSLPITHLVLGATYNNMAEIHHSMENYSTALSYYQKTLEIQKKNPGSSHAKLAIIYKKIVNTLSSLERYAEAAVYEKQAIDVPCYNVESDHSN